jgi:RNA polymerase sigma-70 factor (ECF subfamily)
METPEEDFDAVLAAAREGAEWAVSALYRELHPRLARYLGARESRAAEDLASEVWLAVAQGLHRFDGGPEEFRAWLFSIARRRLADYRRTAARRATEPAPPEQMDRTDDADTERAALDALSSTEAAAFVVRSLPADQAEIVLLRVLGDLGVDQVAEIVGKRPGTVRVLQHRALRRLAVAYQRKSVTP